MKQLLITLFLASALSASISSCKSYGAEKTYNGVQLFYTDEITEKQADKLGNYLIESEFANGEFKTVQMTKTGNTYEFRMVVKKGIDKDPEYCELGKLMAGELSENVFDGEKVNLHFCDEYLKTLKVLTMHPH